nr:protein SIEVE ELEMENT OCCLUSION B-like [Coffea arabica]
MASEMVPTTRGQQLQPIQPIQQLQPVSRPMIENVPTTRGHPMTQATHEIAPSTRGQPSTTARPYLGESRPHFGEGQAHLGEGQAHLGEAQAHLGEVPAAVRGHPPTNVPGILKTQPKTAIAPAGRSGHLTRERHLFSSSDDNAMMKQILAAHAPDGREFDVKALVFIVEDIMRRATFLGEGAQSQAPADTWEDRAIHSGYTDMLELLAYPINKTNSELICKCSSGGDAHSITMALFQTLSSYTWEAKVAIAFAAFAVSYGEFWLVAQLYTTNPLAKSVAVLKELPEIMEHAEALKQKFEAVNNLINAMLNVTHCIVKFKELPTQYINPESPEMISAAAHIPTAVYWTVRSIVACSFILLNLIALGHEFVASAAEAWELNSLAHKLASIKEHLERQMDVINRRIEERRENDAYLALVRLFETTHVDNMKILRALIYAKEDQLPLFDGTHKRRASLDVLRRKHVLLLISDLDMSHEELSVLHQMYTESRQQPTRPESQYEVVWLPVIDRLLPWHDATDKQFQFVQNSMPWYSVAHPMMLDPAVIRFIKENWGFNKKPQLVVLDPQGKDSNRNALHMMWIWGSLAFPFTKAKEEALWREETWRIELLADSIDPNLFHWVNENRYICLYGGEDIEWIRKFTNTVRGAANAAGIRLEMLYVGKSNPKERVRRNNSIIQAENLSHILTDLTLIWFFWVRLESMWHSKNQHGMTVENDPIMQEIVTMLSFDGSDQGWAVFCRGSHEMAKGKAETIYECMSQFDRWKDKVVYPDGFVIAMNDHLRELHTPHHCNRLILPGPTGHIPERVVCAECGRPMERFIMYRCCID